MEGRLSRSTKGLISHNQQRFPYRNYFGYGHSKCPNIARCRFGISVHQFRTLSTDCPLAFVSGSRPYAANKLGEPKIGQLDMPVVGYQDISAFNVAMDYIL